MNAQRTGEQRAAGSQSGQPEKVDAVIVGAGAAGSLMAAKLAQAGKSVVILEHGPAWQLSDLVSSQLHARRHKWPRPTPGRAGEHPIPHNFNAGWGSGGAALHHYALYPRLKPVDFEVRSRYGRAQDWPLAYDDLRPFYDRVQKEIGLSGDAEAEVWRPPGEPYPMKPLKVFKQGEVIARGFEKLDLRTAPMPAAINSEPYNGRAPCLYDGWCDAGCPITALANPLVLYLKAAQEAGAELRTRSTVTGVSTDASGERATAVRYRDAEGNERVQEADVVVLAAYAVQTPRLLLASTNGAHPDGLANSSGLVGAYIMSHPAGSIYGLFEEETEPYMGVTAGQLISHEGYTKDAREGMFGSYQWAIGQAIKPDALLGLGFSRTDLIGDELHDFMRRAAQHFGTMVSLCEELPRRENRVRLGDRQDENGLPRAVVEHTYADETLALWRHTLDEGKRIFEAAGAQEVWTGGLGYQHLMGGTIMGADPTTSVTDGYGKTHDVPNLVIAGPGLFPTSGGVNPTFTVSALSLRSAEHLLASWNDLV